MDFALSEEQEAIFDMARAFGEAEIAPHAQAWDKAGEIPKDLWPKLAELGFGGLYVSEDLGGSGLSRLDATLVFEALSRSCASVAAFLSIHNMCAKMLESYAAPALRDRLLPRALKMEIFLSYFLTEPGSGSVAAALKTKATRTNEGFELTGTGADGPRGISAIVVEDGTEGLSFGGLEDKMGWRSQPTRQVQLDGCRVPGENLLGEEGHGFRYAMAGLDGGRLNIAACSLGAAQAALEATLSYMGERKAFGQSIDQFQGLQFRLADMEIELEAARIFLQQAAWKLDTGAPDATKACAMAKKLVTETGSRVADQCLQLHGGYGYLADYGIEKVVRDLRVHQILEGTNEIMRLIVARSMLAAR